MSDTRAEDGLRPTPPIKTERTHRGLRTVKQSDKECFAVHADLYQPESAYPECAETDCQIPSHGGNFEEFFGGTIGKGTYLIRFKCSEHGGPHWSITSRALYPGWRLLTKRAQGVYLCRRLDATEQQARIAT